MERPTVDREDGGLVGRAAREDGGSIPPAAASKLVQFRSPLCLSEERINVAGPF